MCARCTRRFEAGKPLDCPDCEEALSDGRGGSKQVAPMGDRVQPKLAISAPTDRHEREAEEVADAVMARPVPDRDAPPSEEGVAAADDTGTSQLVSRVTPLRTSSTGSRASGSLDGQEEAHIRSVGGGRPLSGSVRSFFEQRFGTDLSSVRVHTGPTAANAAESIQAKAYTHGTDIVFNRGEFRPHSREGRHLLAHELTHVLQQREDGTRIDRQLGVEDYPDCTPGMTGVPNPEDRLEDGRKRAIEYIDEAISGLQDAATDSAGPDVTGALHAHFDDPTDQQIQRIIGNFRVARGRLELKHRIICNSAGSYYCQQGSAGYAWSGGGPYIHLCPAVFDPSTDPALYDNLIHEAVHVAGPPKDCYAHEACYGSLSSAEAVQNADSYAEFAKDVESTIIETIVW